MSSSPCVSPHCANTRAISLVLLDVARLDERRADRLRQRPDPLLDQALDGREADRRALLVERPGDAPGDRVVVRDAEDRAPSSRRAVPSVDLATVLVGTPAVDAAVTAPRRPTFARPCAGVRALLLDLDGVIVLKGEPLPGAAEALAELEARASRTGS